MRAIILNIGKTSGARLYNMVIGLIILSLTARWLGPEGRGQIYVVITWAVLLSNIGYLSLGEVVIHRAGGRGEESWFSQAFSSLVFLFFILSVITITIAVGLYFLKPNLFSGMSTTMFSFVCILIPIYIWGQYNRALLMAVERLDVFNIFQMGGQTANLFLVLILIGWLGSGVTGALVGVVVGQTILCAGGIRLFWNKASRQIVCSKIEIIHLLKGGLKLHLNAIGSYLFLSADILMINYFKGSEETGYYQLAAQLIGVMMVVAQSASMVLFGKVSSLGVKGAWVFQRKLLIGITGVMIIVGMLAAWLSPFLIPVIAGDGFEASVVVFQSLLFAVVGMTFVSIMGPQWIGRGLFLQASLITLFVGVANVVANYFLIPEYGMMGAVWATVGTYAFAIVGNGILAIICEIEYQKERVLGV